MSNSLRSQVHPELEPTDPDVRGANEDPRQHDRVLRPVVHR